MTLDDLREQVVAANRGLVEAGLVTLSFGNASGVDRERDVMVIKPSGIPCDRLGPADLVAVSLSDGTVVEGSMRPSSDTPTHLVLYRYFASLGGVVHTHSSSASAWAQAGRSIPCLGTTHADHFRGPIRFTAAFNDNDASSAIASLTSRIDRSRSSSAYFLRAGVTPPFLGIRPCTKPGAIHHHAAPHAVTLGGRTSAMPGSARST